MKVKEGGWIVGVPNGDASFEALYVGDDKAKAKKVVEQSLAQGGEGVFSFRTTRVTEWSQSDLTPVLQDTL